MKARSALLVIGGVIIALAGNGCGGGDDGESVPTADELAADLLRPGDLDGAWSITVPEGDVDVPESGVLTDEMQDLLPRFDLCSNASEQAQATASGLHWDAFMQLELQSDDPIQPPDDRTGHMIFLQQYLAATDPADTSATFDLLHQGAQACLGDFEADEEGPGYVETMDVPDLGDDSYGVLMTVEEAGGWAEWLLHHVVVRDGPVLMMLVVTDIRAGEGVEPHFTVDDIGGIARTALEQL